MDSQRHKDFDRGDGDYRQLERRSMLARSIRAWRTGPTMMVEVARWIPLTVVREAASSPEMTGIAIPAGTGPAGAEGGQRSRRRSCRAVRRRQPRRRRGGRTGPRTRRRRSGSHRAEDTLWNTLIATRLPRSASIVAQLITDPTAEPRAAPGPARGRPLAAEYPRPTSKVPSVSARRGGRAES